MVKLIWRIMRKVMDVEDKPGDVYLFQMFLEHDQIHGTSVSYDFSNSWANRGAVFCFNCGTQLFNWSFSYWQQNKKP